jgi:predicted nucleic acid-binding protein
MMLVADASSSLDWFLENPRSAVTERTFRAARKSLLVVPQLWLLETRNALLKLARQGVITESEADEIRVELRLIAKRIDPANDEETADRISELAKAHMMTVYDAAYVELAWRLNLPIASADAAIRAAARALGIKLI